MPAGIFENKCVVVREPAWHRIGCVAPEPLTVDESIAHMGGLPLVTKRRLLWDDGTPSPWWGVGRVGSDGKIAEGFAAVSDGYRAVTLEEFAAAWKQGTDNAKIGTMGVLNGGRIFFITTPLPEMEVRGDALQRHLSVANFNDGENAEVAQIASIRWVCQNTLFASINGGNNVFRIAHDADVMENLIGWMRSAWQTALVKAEAVKEALEIMAGRFLTEYEAEQTVSTAIPLPREPRPSGAPEYDARRTEQWVRTTDKVRVERSTVLGLWRGSGQGMDTRATRGTAFGLYNALAEAYEYVIPSTNATVQARSFLYGERRVIVQRGFDHLRELCRN